MFRSIIFWLLVTILTLFYASAAIVASIFDKSGMAAGRVCRSWSRLILKLARVEVTVTGGEGIDFGRPRIYISNHQSWFDVFALMAWLPGNARFVAKKSLEYIPLFGAAMRAVGTVIIDRNNPEEARRTLTDDAKKQIGASKGIIIFAEGTRSRDGRLQPFKMGGFVLAVQTGIPIVPVAVSGSRAILPADSGRVKPGKILISIGESIETANISLNERHELMQETRDRVEEMLSDQKAAFKQDMAA